MTALAVASKVLMALAVPLSCTLVVPLLLIVTPVPASTETVPWPTARVTVKVPLAPSTSAMLKPEIALAVSSAVVCAAGTVLTGASLTALTVKATLPVADLVPPAPVLPPSLTTMLKLSLPL